MTTKQRKEKKEFADLEKEAFLKSMVEKYYTQGDSYYARKTRKGDKWFFGYSNDYPMQHGDGSEMMLPDGFVTVLMQNGI